ncbi:MAG: ATP-binding protein [Betaproteobacteria bacterium]|jgi:signal transduction histidine kinase|nr:ATP-binding protein [Betaproteobacteria bacterium]MDH5341998.1 ATP-binding protein [Betaproteobacteria bacterium]
MNLLPRSLFSRLVLVLLGGLLTAQLLSFAIHMHDRGELLAQASGMQSAQRIADIVRLLDTMTPAERNKIVKVLSAPPLTVRLDRGPLSPPEAENEAGARAALFTSLLLRYLGDGRLVVVGMAQPGPYPGGGGGGMHRPQRGDGDADLTPPMMHYGARGGGLTFVAQVGLQDGTLATFDTRQLPATENWPFRVLLSIGLLLTAVIVVSLIAVRWATRPLKTLADAADELGRNINRPPLAETGPTEVVSAARAFNTMQSRLATYLRERTQVLAAMSHDLKTPITRLRLRAELLEDAQLRTKFGNDLQEMEAMVASALDFLRGMDNGETVRPVDVNALLESLQADLCETGGTVTIEGRAMGPYPGRPQALKRCFSNLLENAIKYGRSAQVIVDDGAERLQISIRDEGPGLPPEQLEKVFEPFYRVEGSRNRDTGGTGLGLAIAKNVVELHGGHITLRNHAAGGLEAVMALPRT